MGLFDVFKSNTPEKKVEKLSELETEEQRKRDLEEWERLDNGAPNQLDKGAFKKMIEDEKKAL